MYDGKQVLRFVNNYKTKDLYFIGNEMNKRIGTGNYDSERTKFNVHYKDINKNNVELNKSKEVLENNIKNTNLNIKKNIVGYSSKDVEKLIDYSNDLERLNNINKNKLDSNSL